MFKRLLNSRKFLVAMILGHPFFLLPITAFVLLPCAGIELPGILVYCFISLSLVASVFVIVWQKPSIIGAILKIILCLIIMVVQFLIIGILLIAFTGLEGIR